MDQSYYLRFNYGDEYECTYVLTPEFSLASEFSDYYCEFRIMEAKWIQHLLASHPLWPLEWSIHISRLHNSTSVLDGDTELTQENCIAIIDELKSTTIKYHERE